MNGKEAKPEQREWEYLLNYVRTLIKQIQNNLQKWEQEHHFESAKADNCVLVTNKVIDIAYWKDFMPLYIIFVLKS